MRAFLEQYGIAIFVILIIGIMTLMASGVGVTVEGLLKDEIKRFTDKSVSVNNKNLKDGEELKKNEYGFYFDKVYVSNWYDGVDRDCAIFKENGETYWYYEISDKEFNEYKEDYCNDFGLDLETATVDDVNQKIFEEDAWVSNGSYSQLYVEVEDGDPVWFSDDGTKFYWDEEKTEFGGELVKDYSTNDQEETNNTINKICINHIDRNKDNKCDNCNKELTAITTLIMDWASGNQVWTDGENIYESWRTDQYMFKDGIWVDKTWNGLDNIYGYQIWTDGTNIYHSDGSSQHVLNEDTWTKKTWNGLTDFNGGHIWTDGNKIYYSYETDQYVLDGNTWKPQTWNGFTPEYGSNIWTDGTKMYYSYYDEQYVLNGNTWSAKTWNGLDNIEADYIWSDGVNVYYSRYSSHYVLNGNTWIEKNWNISEDFCGDRVWSDGTNYYYQPAK